jgi:hypothetical protein
MMERTANPRSASTTSMRGERVEVFIEYYLQINMSVVAVIAKTVAVKIA